MATKNKGFTLVELVAVLLIVAVLASTASIRFLSNSTFQLQASRDQLVSAIKSAQQLAMIQADRVQLQTGPNGIDIQQDRDGSGNFSSDESVYMDGVQYPLVLKSSQTISNNSFLFDRLGRTSPGFVTLTQEGNAVTVTISSSGHAE